MSAPDTPPKAGFGRGLVPGWLKPAAALLLSIPPVFRAWERYTASRFPRPPATGSDGLPLPDRLRMVQVVAHADWRVFEQTGADTIGFFDAALSRHGSGFAGAGAVLDFGCGCGRLIRHLPARTKAQLYGTDLNPRLAGWCADNLPGTFASNGLRPPLTYADEQFDVMYALSVFTHLREATQRAWLAEFARILKPGALALITFHDENQRGVDPAWLAYVAECGFAVRSDAMEGSNLPATYQTHAYISEMAAGAFEVLETISSTDTPFRQALAVLRRR